MSSRNSVIVFLLTTFVFSWLLEFYIISFAGFKTQWPVFVLMWVPGLVGASLVVLSKDRFKNIGFRRPKMRYLGIAYLVPVVGAFIVFLLLLFLKIDGFELSSKLVEKGGSIPKALLLILFIVPFVDFVVPVIAALGEEIGWRGFLHTHMTSLGVKHRNFWIGLIWAVWHWPLILFTDYSSSPYPILSVALFTFVVIAFSYIMGWLRDESNSLWPNVIAHAAHNTWLLTVTPFFLKKGELDPYFGGESGVLLPFVYLSIFLVLRRRAKA